MNAVENSPSPTPRVSVLIPAYNEEALIRSVLESVHGAFAALADSAAAVPYEIVVCDNNSTDKTAEVAKAYGARVVFEPHNQIARARNTAAASGLGEWFIFLDGDTFLNAPLLRATLAALDSGKIGAGGTTVTFDRPQVGVFAAGLTALWNTISRVLRLAAGSYIFCSRQAWKDTGGFDEEIYAGEELFFSRKLKRWSKNRSLRFVILSDTPIVTSARKMEWYSTGQLLWKVLAMSRPGAMRRREDCDLWYTRPGDCRGLGPAETPKE